MKPNVRAFLFILTVLLQQQQQQRLPYEDFTVANGPKEGGEGDGDKIIKSSVIQFYDVNVNKTVTNNDQKTKKVCFTFFSSFLSINLFLVSSS